MKNHLSFIPESWKKRRKLLLIAAALLFITFFTARNDAGLRFRFGNLLPENAREIRVWRNRMLFPDRLEWQCRVPEADFLAWCEMRSYHCRKSSPVSAPVKWYNANPAGGTMCGANDSLVFFRHLPENFLPEVSEYYFYNHRNDNAEGITLLYDRAGKRLFGSSLQ